VEPWWQDLAPPAGGRGQLAPWWFADALVVVIGAINVGDAGSVPGGSGGGGGGAGDGASAEAVAEICGDGFQDVAIDGYGDKIMTGRGAAAKGAKAPVGHSRQVQHPPLPAIDAGLLPPGSPVPLAWLRTLARVAGQMGPGAVFVLCEVGPERYCSRVHPARHRLKPSFVQLNGIL
jgi:hypothetical protein